MSESFREHELIAALRADLAAEKEGALIVHQQLIEVELQLAAANSRADAAEAEAVATREVLMPWAAWQEHMMHCRRMGTCPICDDGSAEERLMRVAQATNAGSDLLARLEALPLWLHLVSEHAGIYAPEGDLHDMHEHEHNGLGTIRNHERTSRAYSLVKVADVLGEAEGARLERAEFALAAVAVKCPTCGGTGKYTDELVISHALVPPCPTCPDSCGWVSRHEARLKAAANLVRHLRGGSPRPMSHAVIGALEAYDAALKAEEKARTEEKE